MIRLGSRIGPDGKFEAHAWFTVGDAVVTGWDIERFAEFAPFPLDEVLHASPAYRWTLNHTLAVDDPLELFPTHLVTLDARKEVGV